MCFEKKRRILNITKTEAKKRGNLGPMGAEQLYGAKWYSKIPYYCSLNALRNLKLSFFFENAASEVKKYKFGPYEY